MIRKLIKWFAFLCLLLLAGGIALVVFKDVLIRNLTERRILRQTGLYARIDRMHVGFTEPVISFQGFKLYNRPEFGGGVLLDLADLHLEYDPEALKSGELHLTRLRLDLQELNVVRSVSGQTNILEFLQQTETEGRDALSRSLPSRDFGFTGVDTLDLSLGRIRFIDLGDPRRNREAYFGLQHMEIKNIRDTGDLYGVAGLVLIRSGLLNPRAPSGPSAPASDNPLEMAWGWAMEQLGIRTPDPAATNRQPGEAP